MRVFVAGATGAIGRQLVPRLVAAGHEVHGMTRSESKQAMLFEMGAVPVVADALDPDQVAEAVGRARPDVIVHQLTAIPETLHMRHFDRDFALTNRLRTEGTDHLLSAGQAVGVRRFVAQSYFAQYARTGAAVKSEEDPIDRAPARQIREVLAAIRHLEAAVLDARWTEGIVLRYGALYGPGTSLAAGRDQAELVRRHKFPLVDNGRGVWSFVHVADAAEATVAAVEHGSRGVYNVVDDDPAPVAQWLPALAEEVGAKKPSRVPRLVGRLFAGELGVERRRPRFETTREQRDELARRFFAAAEEGDLAGLEALLAHDARLTGDGGGKVPALARSVRGRNRVAGTLINWFRLAGRFPGVSLRPVEVNGGPGALFLDAHQRLIGVCALDIADGQVISVSSIVNPDKLTHLGPVADFGSLLKSAT